MKQEATKLSERAQKLTNELKNIEENPIMQTIVRKSQQSKENRRIKRKIEDINRKIRRAKGKTKRNLLIKRDLLKLIDSHSERISKLRHYESEFHWIGMKYPVSVKDISKFETTNRIRVNVLALNGRTPYICRKGADYERSVNLMILEEGKKKHYVAIKSLERLLSKMNSKHNPAQHFCNNCLQVFSDATSRDNHYEYCRSNESVRIEMPTRNPIVEYSKGQHQFKVPFIMYADFESILELIQGVSNDSNVSSTRRVNTHKPLGWCLHSKFAYGKVKNPTTQYRGTECVEKFCEKIIGEAKRLCKSFPEKPMIPLTKEQASEFKKATKCQKCFKEFKDKGKV